MAEQRLLLVDDDRLVLATLSEGLRERGFDVLQTASGKEALRLAADNDFELALLDVRMPGLSGFEVAKHLWKEHGVPTVFLSAYSDAELVKEAVGYEGVLGYLVKPLGVEQILPTLETALVRSREVKALESSVENLHTAMTQSRDTSVAIGILMERLKLQHDEAFEALRGRARNTCAKIEILAAQLVSAVDSLNTLHSVRDGAPPRKKARN